MSGVPEGEAGAPLDYAAAVLRVEAAVRTYALMAGTVDIAACHEAVVRTHTVGMFLDPTAYHKALHDGRLDRQAELWAAVAPLHAYLQKHYGKELALLAGVGDGAA